MCCAPLELLEDNQFARCTYCGTLYTLPLDEQREEEKEETIKSLMERARLSLKDEQFELADSLFDKVLNLDPSLGEAYLGKGMAELSVTTLQELGRKKREALKNYFIGKALNFCVQPLRGKLYQTLGLRDKESGQKATWLESTTEIRSRFGRELHMMNASSSAELFQQIGKINEDFNQKTKGIKEKLEGYQQSLRKLNTKEMNTELQHVEDQILIQRNQLLRELECAEEERKNRINQLYSEHTSASPSGITAAQFSELTEKYPLPPLPDTYKGTIVEKTLAVVLATYDFLSYEEICHHPLLAAYPEKRLLPCVKKNVLDKLIIQMERDGKTVYAGPELEGITITP